jgi:hypothetical protein
MGEQGESALMAGLRLAESNYFIDGVDVTDLARAELSAARERIARMEKHIALQDRCAAAAANLLVACWEADAAEELPGEVDGLLMDGVKEALWAMYPSCPDCASAYEDESVCQSCRGLCVVMPPALAQQERP